MTHSRLFVGSLTVLALTMGNAAAQVPVRLSGPHVFQSGDSGGTTVRSFAGRVGAASLRITTDLGTRKGRFFPAKIWLNDLQVATPRDLGSHTVDLEIPISLIERNVIRVDLDDEPGAALTLEVLQLISADAAAVIDESGGMLEVQQGPFSGASISVPPGAVIGPTIFSARAASDPFEADNVAPVLELEPHGLTFHQPVTVALPSPNAHRGYDGFYYGPWPSGPWGAISSSYCGAALRCASLSSFGYTAIREDSLWHVNSDILLSLSGTHPPSEVTTTFAPILLVHGYNPGGGQPIKEYWGDYPRLLTALGLDVWSVYFDTSRGIRENARRLSDAVGKVLAASHRERLVVVAHSMGGLVGRAYVQYESGDARTLRLITLGTPHLGTNAARSCGHDSCLDMRPDSDFLLSLRRDYRDRPRRPSAGTAPFVLLAGQRYRSTWLGFGGCAPDDEEFGHRSAFDGGTDGVVSWFSALGGSGDAHLELFPGGLAEVERIGPLAYHAHSRREEDSDCANSAIVPSDAIDVAHQHTWPYVAVPIGTDSDQCEDQDWVNGSFECGSGAVPDGWRRTSRAFPVQPRFEWTYGFAHTGVRSIELGCPPSSGSTTSWSFNELWSTRTLPALAGQEYVVSLWYYLDSELGPHDRLVIGFNPRASDGTALLGFVDAVPGPLPVGRWVYAEYGRELPNPQMATVGAVVSREASVFPSCGATLWIDDVSIRPR